MKIGGFQLRILAFLSLVFVTNLVAAATSCDVAASRNTVLPMDFTETQGTARSLVFGEGQGSFNDATIVEIDCNVKNVKPEPVNKYVKARIIFTQSTLSYRGDCFYPRPMNDTTYAVGARILPENVGCVRSVQGGTVTTPGSGREEKKTTPVECGIVGSKVCEGLEKCKEPAVHDGYGSCTACPDGTKYSQGRCIKSDEKEGPALGKLVCLEGEVEVNGKCIVQTRVEPDCPEGYTYNKNKGICVQKMTNEKKEDPEDPDEPEGPSEDADFVIGVRKKAAYIGIPFLNAELVESTCERAKFYTYNSKKKKYVRLTIDEEFGVDQYGGQGILVQSKTPCTIAVDGEYEDEQTIELIKGWNFVSVQTEAFMKAENIEHECSFKSIYSHHHENGKKIKEKQPLMKPGVGYWIKVKNSCTLSASSEGDIPMLPEENTSSDQSKTQTIEPQGGKSRRFIPDAG